MLRRVFIALLASCSLFRTQMANGQTNSPPTQQSNQQGKPTEPVQPNAQQQQPAKQATQPVQQPQQFQQSPAWANLPKMRLERQFAGPLQDTIVQRWRDPVDGAICYIYLPISAPVTPPNVTGFQQYGANVIGSISCMSGNGKSVAPTPAAKQ